MQAIQAPPLQCRLLPEQCPCKHNRDQHEIFTHCVDSKVAHVSVAVADALTCPVTLSVQSPEGAPAGGATVCPKQAAAWRRMSARTVQIFGMMLAAPDWSGSHLKCTAVVSLLSCEAKRSCMLPRDANQQAADRPNHRLLGPLKTFG